jgi:RND family efflux transporter MFP subunit
MKQLILILLTLALAVGVGYWLMETKPDIKKRSKKPSIPVVKIVSIKKQSYQLKIHASGSVKAHTETTLVAEIAGKITRVDHTFAVGNYINKNQTLLTIDKTDYLNNIELAKSEIAQKQLALEEQIAQANLAKQDWDLFGEKKKTPSKLAMREPHIKSAKAALKSAKLRIQQAEVNLARSTVKAPYTGRVLERSVAIGQYVTPGTKLGKIFATDYVEVHLPLSLADYEQLNLPEHYQGEKQPTPKNLPLVTFYTHTGTTRHQWQGKLVRSAATLNENTRQISVIAHINTPFSRSKTGTPPVKIGQFLQAEISAKRLTNVALIPSSAVRENREILLLDGDKIQRQIISIIATDKDKVVISTENLPLDKALILTPPPFATQGMKVKVWTAKNQSNH